MKKATYETDLTKGSVVRHLLVFGLPFLLSSIVQALYSTADLYIVSQFCSSASVSGVNIGGQLLNLVVFFVMGLSVGGTILIAQYKGADRQDLIGKTIATLLTMLLIASVVLTVIMLLLRNQILALLDTPEESFSQANAYFSICMLGTPFIFWYNCIAGILRGLGDSKRPLYFVMIACVVNVVLDFILVPLFDAGGAAAATVVAQGVSVVLSAVYLRRSNFSFDFRLKSFKIDKEQLGKILKIGLPSGIQSLIVNGSFLVMTTIVNGFGVDASAAVGIVGRYNQFAILPSSAIASAVSAMVAQNVGANKNKRALQTMWVGVGLCMAVGVVGLAIFELFPDELMRLFTDDPTVIEFGVLYIRALAFDLIVVPFVFCMSNFANGTGHTVVSMVSNIFSALLLRVPASLLLGKTMGLGLLGVGIGVPVATFGTSLILAIYIATGLWKKRTVKITTVE